MAPAPVTTQRPLGRSDSTQNALNAAVNLHNVYRVQRKGLPTLDKMVFTEIADDNLEMYFLNFTRFCASTAIPARFDENLNAKKEGSMAMLTMTTLAKYIGKVKDEVRRKYPDHTDWQQLKKDDDPSWYSPMLAGFKTMCTRFQLTLSPDFVFGEKPIRALYADNGNNLPSDESKINDYISVIDLKYINQKLVNNSTLEGNQKLQQRAWLTTSYSAAGRGGEVKYQDFTEWTFDPKLEVLDPHWTELKRLAKYSMPIVVSKEDWVNDPIHSIASFWAVENGLFRGDDEDGRALLNSVFPDLYQMKDSSVTSKLTTIIRDNLPVSCPMEIKSLFTAKSMRQAAITQMSIHPELGLFDTCARSGHSTGTTLDTYLDKNGIARGIRGAKGMAGYRFLDFDGKMPRLECLGFQASSRAVSDFVDKLFVVSIPAFKVQGHLHIVLKISAASLLMNHCKVTSECGYANAISSKIRNAAREANIVDCRYPNMSPEQIVDEWSKMVMEDFNLRNLEIAKAQPDAPSIAATLNQCVALLTTMSTDINELKLQNGNAITTIATQKSQISQLHNEIAGLKSGLHESKKKLAFIRTPESSPPTRARTATKRSADESVLAAANSDDSRSSTRQRTTATSTARKLDYGNEARAVAESHSDGEKQIKNAIVHMAMDGLLYNPDLKDTDIPKSYSDRQKMVNTLELMQIVISAEERQILTSAAKNEDKEALIQVSEQLQRKCMDQMCVYEQIDPEIERKNKHSRKRPTYLGIGNRVSQYKKVLIELSGNNIKPKDQPLVNRSDIPTTAGGTPPDNFSIAKMFACPDTETPGITQV